MAGIPSFYFLKPTIFSFGYEYYASARMVASKFNRQIIVFAEVPSNPLLILPFKVSKSLKFFFLLQVTNNDSCSHFH